MTMVASVKPLMTAEVLQKRVQELGQHLSQVYEGQHPVVLGLLKGVVPFYADLVRAMSIDIEMQFMQVSSYGSGMSSSGKLNIRQDLTASLEHRPVLLVDDIMDTGLTLFEIKEYVLKRGAREVKICTLLDKPSRRQFPLHPDFIGFEIPDHFVVGYGLDYQERFRNLPYIGIYTP
ncbi:MAG: hypoxanthine phosphoribosyltransferase [Holophagaceae bacterium]|jgi:hypoxanthine phosphoribosyltransferase